MTVDRVLNCCITDTVSVSLIWIYWIKEFKIVFNLTRFPNKSFI
jgi:hypothetical protein